MIKLSKVFLQRGWVQIKVLGSGITIKASKGIPYQGTNNVHFAYLAEPYF